MKTFIERFFSCCHTKKQHDDINHLINSKNESRLDAPPETSYLSRYDLDMEKTSIMSNKVESSVLKEDQPQSVCRYLFDDRLIREEERNMLTFTRKGLIAFVNEISNMEGYNIIHNKNGFVLYNRTSGTTLNPSLSVTKSLFTLPKSELNKSVDITYLVNLMFDPLNRLSWDVTLKTYEKLEGDDDTCVIRSVMHSPMLLVSEREIVDKRVHFVDNGIYYNLSTSTPEDFFPLKDNLVRVKTYFNVSLIQEEQDSFIFTSISQIDFKINLPQQLLNATIPGKMVSWYGTFIKAINKDN